MIGTPPVDISAAVAERYGAVKVGYLIVTGVIIASTPSRQRKAARRVEAAVRQAAVEGGPSPELCRWQDFSVRMGLVSDEVLPAPITLARRVLNGGSIPRINNVVDAGNMTALLYLCPVGVFDLDGIDGRVELRPACPGESMRPMSRAAEVPLEPGELVYADPTQVFSRYSRDAERTRVTTATTSILCLVDGTPETPVEHVQEALGALTVLLHDVGGPGLTVEFEILVAR